MSSTKRSLAVRATWLPLIAVGTVLLGLCQAAAQPGPPVERPEAADDPMRPSEETRANDGQQSSASMPAGLDDTLRAADELAAALSTANEKFEALAGVTKNAATELYRRLEATRRQRDDLSAALVDVQGKLHLHEAREKELAAHVVALGEKARQSEADIAGLRLELEASEQRRRQLEAVGSELAQLKDEILGLGHLLERANVALGQAQQERDAARAETEALRAEVAALLNTALASLNQTDRPVGASPSAGLAPRGNFVRAPMQGSPQAQDRREAGL